MKKIILSAIVAVCSLTANAQVWMGGSLGFDMTDYEGRDNNETVFSIAPEVGYSLNENWDVAVALSFASTTNALGVKDANVTEFAVNPYARYTFAKAGQFGFFLDGGISFGSYKPKDVDATTSFYIGIKPGVKFAATDKITFVAHLGSLGYKTVKDTYNTFGFGVDNNTLLFGMYWAF